MEIKANMIQDGTITTKNLAAESITTENLGGGTMGNITKTKESWRTKKIYGRPWQDWIFAIGEIVFLATLIPLLFRDANVPLFTGLGTAIMLYTFVAAHVSYKNWITVSLTTITATLWVLIGLGVHL